MKTSNKILKNQKGQGVLEYIILTGLIGIFCLAAVGKVGQTIKSKFGQINTQIQHIEVKRN